MPSIHIKFDDAQWNALQAARGKQTWKNYILSAHEAVVVPASKEPDPQQPDTQASNSAQTDAATDSTTSES